ncbi:hypothetical protein BSKO_04231 [Bryopsis sp. KO-2023]|nr:hypothetical protein BSKO_04231 [Bryopsis sp. KO-2023]
MEPIASAWLTRIGGDVAISCDSTCPQLSDQCSPDLVLESAAPGRREAMRATIFCADRAIAVALALLVLSSRFDSAIGRKRQPKRRASNGPFILERRSQTYLPTHYGDGEPKFCMGTSAAEQISFDADQQILYVVGYQIIHVLDIEYPKGPIILGHMRLSHDITDVASCGDLVAVSETDYPKTQPGYVHIFETVKQGKKSKASEMTRLFKVQVGALPDMLTFSKDCEKIFVANEGEPGKNKDGEFVDPQGSISIIDVQKLQETNNVEDSVNTIDFKSFNEDADSLTDAGVRWVRRGAPGGSANSFSQDLEPEYIALSKDGKTAYVCLQENNAVGVVDLEKEEVVSIIPLGLKNFADLKSKIDGSDRDDGAEMESWPVFGVYQPDAIASFHHAGEDYLVTANEGASQQVDEDDGVGEFSDATSGFGVAKEMSSSIDDSIIDALEDETKMGRLGFSAIDGWSEQYEDGEKVRDKLVMFGGRSFTIFRARDMKPVFDSGDDLEHLNAELFPWAFNSKEPGQFCVENELTTDINADTREVFDWIEAGKGTKPSRNPFMSKELMREKLDEAKEELKEFESTENPWEHGLAEPSLALTTTPLDLSDHSSTLSGTSPETLTVGIVNGRRLLFVANEKGSTVFVYDITDPENAVWHSAVYPGFHDATWAELYNEKMLVDVDPEGLEFVSAEDSPSGEALLIVSGSLSGTVSIYSISQQPSDAIPRPVLQRPSRTENPKRGIIIDSTDDTVNAVNADLV